MKKLTFIVVLLAFSFGYAQNNGNVKGTVLDGEFNNEVLAFAKIIVKNTNQKVDSDIQGNYILNLKPGIYTLIYEFVGYESIEIKGIEVGNNNLNLRDVILITKKITFENNIASKG